MEKIVRKLLQRK